LTRDGCQDESWDEEEKRDQKSRAKRASLPRRSRGGPGHGGAPFVEDASAIGGGREPDPVGAGRTGSRKGPSSADYSERTSKRFHGRAVFCVVCNEKISDYPTFRASSWLGTNLGLAFHPGEEGIGDEAGGFGFVEDGARFRGILRARDGDARAENH